MREFCKGGMFLYSHSYSYLDLLDFLLWIVGRVWHLRVGVFFISRAL